MQNYIPTIEELRSKPTRDLLAIFRSAAEVAADRTSDPSERFAATRTMENVSQCLVMRRTPCGPR